MREKKYIKLRTDMYEDTKFKIIDTMEKRDTINYIWTRLLALCGKINEPLGYLFVTKDVPYTIEVLSIEFNRSKKDIEDAINVFIDLKMMTKENGVLRVCNWNKHQTSKKAKKVSEDSKKAEDCKKQSLEVIDENKEKLSIKEKETEKIIAKADKSIDKKKKDKPLKSNNSSESRMLEFSGNTKKKSEDYIKDKNIKRKNSKNNITELNVTDNEDNEIEVFRDYEERNNSGKLIACFDFS